MPSAHSEGRSKNTSWSYDRATYYSAKAQSSKGSFCQIHNIEACAQEPRIFIGFPSEHLHESTVQIADFVDPIHLYDDNS